MAKLGWIGLGNMGVPMTKNLLKAEYDLTVWNRTKSKAQPVLDEGAAWGDSPKVVAESCDVIFTMVSDGNVLKAVTMGDNGIVSGLSKGKIVIDMSTVSPEESAEVNAAIEAAGAKFLRAPVTGSTVLAANASLGILASGDKNSYDDVLPCFQAMGKNQFYLGGGEEARVMKLALNMMIGTSMQMLAETMVLAEKGGLDWEQTLEVIGGSAVASPLVGYKVGPVSKRVYDPAFSVKLMEKDFDLALTAARQFGVSLPITAVTRQYLASANARGKADKDFSVLVELAEEMSGIK